MSTRNNTLLIVTFIVSLLCHLQDANNTTTTRMEQVELNSTSSTIKPVTISDKNQAFQYKNIPWLRYRWNGYDFIPNYFNWLDRGAPRNIKTQMPKCNACWAYAVATLAEVMYFVDISRPVLTPSMPQHLYSSNMQFSEDELLMCYGKGDCKHRSTHHALEYSYVHGLVPLNEYNRGMHCPGSTNFKFRALYTISPDENSIASYIVNHGPVILHLYLPVHILKNYIGIDVVGPFPECEGKPPNHAMIAVGFGEQFGLKYWLLKNSWGPDWGDYGYIKWRRGINACKIEANPIGASFVYHKW